jgi:hypothetical protein
MAAPVCTICISEKRASIDLALVYRLSAPVIARRYGVSVNAVRRHRHSHLTPQVRAAILAAMKPSEVDLEQLERTESEGLLAHQVAQRARLQVLSEMAVDAADVRAAVRVESAITANLELSAKLLGQLVTRHEVRSTSILVSADYITLRQAIVQALRPFPEAARAVGNALHALESRAAEEIKADAAKGRPLLLEGRSEALEVGTC